RPLVLALATGSVLFIVTASILILRLREVLTSRPLGKDIRSRQRALVMALLLSFGLVYSANTSVGRLCLGPEAAFASRYMTLMIPVFLGIYFGLISMIRGSARLLALGLFGLLVLHGSLRVPPEAAGLAQGKRAWADCYRKTEDIGYCDQTTHFQVY